MRKSLRDLTLIAVVILMLSLAMIAVQAQEATEEPTVEATTEPTIEATSEATVEVTPEMTEEPDADNGDMATVTCGSELVVQLYIAARYFGYGQMNMAGADVAPIDRGQFAPLFDNIPAMSDTEIRSIDTTASTSAVTGDMATPAVFADEPRECALLRADLNRFFTAVAIRDLNTGSGPVVEVTPDVEVTAEVTAEATVEAEMIATPDTTDTTSGDSVSFRTNMSGPSEVPGPGDADAIGTAAFTMDFANGQICYDVTVQNINYPVTGMHIHRGGVTEAGDVVVPLEPVPDVSTGNAVGCVLVEADLLNEIASNPAGFYLNVHNNDFPAGALRGQVSS